MMKNEINFGVKSSRIKCNMGIIKNVILMDEAFQQNKN